MTTIERYGWREEVKSGIARVTSSHGDYYHLIANEAEGEIIARCKKAAFREREVIKPITGDFVRFEFNANGESMITELLPRFSVYERRDPTSHRQAQTLAVNFDCLLLMMSLNENFSLPRLNRYLDLASALGRAEALIVLTKRDLLTKASDLNRYAELPDGGEYRGVNVCWISTRTGEGLSAIKARACAGRTLAVIGSSGVGKSSLVNALAGEEWVAVQEVQSWSGKGRHTTTSRDLIMLPNGAMIVDTPGIREIGRVGENEVELVKGCSTHRFRVK